MRHIFIYEGADGDFKAQHLAPQATKDRVLYFWKAANVTLTISNIEEHVVLNECNPEQTLEELLTISQEVFLPLISDGEAQVRFEMHC